MAHEARFRNAQLRYFIGEFNWAVNALDILKGSTSKLIANDAMSLSILISDNQNIDTAALSLFAKADYASYRRQDKEAKIFLDEIINKHSNATSTPYALIRLAKIAQRDKDFNAVDSLCTVIYSDFPESFVADQALMLDAKILAEELKNKEKALKCYEKILDEYNVSLYLAEARKNYRLLK